MFRSAISNLISAIDWSTCAAGSQKRNSELLCVQPCSLDLACSVWGHCVVVRFL